MKNKLILAGVAIVIAVALVVLSNVVAAFVVPTPTIAKNAYPITVASAEKPAASPETPTADTAAPAATDATAAAPAEAAATAPVAEAPAAPAEPSFTELLAKADPAKGATVTKVCAACHGFDKGGANKIGPNLYGVVGRAAGSVADFKYSEGMKARAGKPWDFEALNTFLTSPKDLVKGTKMTFAGLKKPEDRAAAIAYLRSLAEKPVDLPAAK